MSQTEAELFQAPDATELAALLSDYEIHGLVAVGGMGAVYKAVQKSLDRVVAIKVLPREFSEDAEFCRSFQSEAKAMARLNHPNLIGVYDFGEVGGLLYIVMEYVAGQTLYEVIYGQAVGAAEAIRLISGICSGLSHAHEYGILHRDIKPANIMLDADGQPKIGDFGLARHVDVQVREGDTIFGTPHYTAPEVLTPPYTVDQRTDIFSVGVMLHELLTGSLPDDDPRTPSAISHCDSRFDEVVRKATHPQPNKRYWSADEIINDLNIIATTDAPRVVARATRAAPAPRVAPRAAPKMAHKRLPRHVVSKKSPANVGNILMMVLLVAAVVYLCREPIMEFLRENLDIPTGTSSSTGY